MEVWESAWGEWEVCWGVGGGEGSCVGRGVRECMGWVGKCVGMWGEEWGRCREVCLGVGPQHTSPHLLLHLTFSYISLTSPTPQHTFLHLLSYLFPHLPFLPPYLNTFSYYSHISPHLLKVWRSFCGEVTGTMWRSYWQRMPLPDYYTVHTFWSATNWFLLRYIVL